MLYIEYISCLLYVNIPYIPDTLMGNEATNLPYESGGVVMVSVIYGSMLRFQKRSGMQC